MYRDAAKDWKLPLKRPWHEDDFKLPKPAPARKRRLEDGHDGEAGEEERIRAALAAKAQGAMTLDLLDLAVELGMRQSEVLGITAEQVKKVAGVTFIDQPDSKTGPRHVILTKLAAEIVARHRKGKKDEERLFPWKPADLRQRWNAALKSAGIKGLRWHDLRHEALTRMHDDKGMNLRDCQEAGIANIVGKEHPKTCIFCETGLTTKEHVWGKWLRPSIPLNDTKYESALIKSDISSPERQDVNVKVKGGDPRNLTVKCVCEICNNGWMSQLQERTRDIITPMALGQAAELSLDDVVTLANWCTMVSMTSEYVHPTTVCVSQREREYFYKHRTPPPTFRIFGGKLPLGQWKPVWVRYGLELSDESGAAFEVDAGRPNTQASTHVIGQLFLHILSSPSYGVLHTWKGIPLSAGSPFGQIWPPANLPLRWPPSSDLTGDLADQVAGAFADTFGMKIRKPENI